MRNNLFKFLLLALCSLLLVSCASNKKEEVSNTESKEVATTSSNKLIVYSNAVSSGRGEAMKEFFSKHGLEVEFVDLGGNALSNRLVAEKNAPIADAVFGLNEMVFRQIEAQAPGIWKEFTPAWKADLEASSIPEGGRFYPVNEARVFMIYDAAKITSPVKDWLDAANNASLKEKYLVPNSLGGQTAIAIVYNNLLNYVDTNGDLNISEDGWKALETYFANGVTPSEGKTPITELVEGKVDYSYTWLSNVPLVEKEYGIKLGVVNPPYGVAQTFEQVGIINKENVKPEAQKFADLLGDPELMAIMAEKFGFVPANTKAKGSINPRVLEILDNTTPQKTDFNFVGSNVDKWVEKIELNYLR